MGNAIWWPLRMGPTMMDASSFAELEPYEPQTKRMKTQLDTTFMD